MKQSGMLAMILCRSSVLRSLPCGLSVRPRNAVKIENEMAKEPGAARIPATGPGLLESAMMQSWRMNSAAPPACSLSAQV